jgi:hypothetical protein
VAIISRLQFRPWRSGLAFPLHDAERIEDKRTNDPT